MCAKSRTRTVVWVGAGDLASPVGFEEEAIHCGRPSQAGEGICWENGWAGVAVVMVDVEDSVDVDVTDDATRAGADGSGVADAIYLGLVPCWGRAPADVRLGEEDEGGEGM